MFRDFLEILEMTLWDNVWSELLGYTVPISDRLRSNSSSANCVGCDANSTKDKKCPFTGMVSIRGRILTGKVVSTKMHRTIIVRRDYLHYVPKYDRYEKRHKNLAAHVSPAFRVEEGDMVVVGQCRPLSKTVRTLRSRPLCKRILMYQRIGPLQRPPCPAAHR